MATKAFRTRAAVKKTRKPQDLTDYALRGLRSDLENIAERVQHVEVLVDTLARKVDATAPREDRSLSVDDL